RSRPHALARWKLPAWSPHLPRGGGFSRATTRLGEQLRTPPRAAFRRIPAGGRSRDQAFGGACAAIHNHGAFRVAEKGCVSAASVEGGGNRSPRQVRRRSLSRWRLIRMTADESVVAWVPQLPN